ncbi:Nudix hydrolase 4 [Hibiscus syriacus]|uniref:Nudix hydrolase 4 n=1 Tax=Hibiscus syriacus TaxID=106335 RepID=A0A6A2YRP3_HIBSY|nr:Nudix hydrolase 4 [Hibiscus syriacus]
MCMVARTGRHLQRYDNLGRRQVAGCIPYRFKCRTDGTITNDLEVLVISSQKGPKMMFPKGGWEIDESIEEAALRESIEEAGVLGHVECELGKWYFISKNHGTFYEGLCWSRKSSTCGLSSTSAKSMAKALHLGKSYLIFTDLHPKTIFEMGCVRVRHRCRSNHVTPPYSTGPQRNPPCPDRGDRQPPEIVLVGGVVLPLPFDGHIYWKYDTRPPCDNCNPQTDTGNPIRSGVSH